MRLILTCLASWTVILMSLPASARYDAGTGDSHTERLAQVATQLELTDAQKLQMQTVEDQTHPHIEQLRAAARTARQRFTAGLGDDRNSVDELSRLNEAFIKAKTDLMRARFERMLALRSILNKDQLKKFLAAMERHGPHRDRSQPKAPGLGN